MTRSRRVLKPGIYVPLPTFFDEEQELDLASYEQHLLRMCRCGMVPVCSGSLGEAVHLDPAERVRIIQFIRQTLDREGLQDRPIVAGVGGLSTRETVKLAHDAADAGADAGMVILPAYFAAALQSDPQQIVEYYVEICDQSPADVLRIPIVLYNFPTNAAGLDMSSEIIAQIMDRAPNLCGVKLTCGGSIAKLLRLKAHLVANPRPDFLLLDGRIDDLTPWVVCGGHGTVSGIPNFAPVASTRLWRLLDHARTTRLTFEEEAEAARIQNITSRADVAAVPGGIRAMKYALSQTRGYPAAPRRPLLPIGEADGKAFMRILDPLLELEREYETKGL